MKFEVSLIARFEREHHVGAVEFFAAVEGDALAEREDPDVAIVGRRRPGRGECGLHLTFHVADDERLVDLVHQGRGRPLVLGMRVERERLGRACPAQRLGGKRPRPSARSWPAAPHRRQAITGIHEKAPCRDFFPSGEYGRDWPLVQPARKDFPRQGEAKAPRFLPEKVRRGDAIRRCLEYMHCANDAACRRHSN